MTFMFFGTFQTASTGNESQYQFSQLGAFTGPQRSGPTLRGEPETCKCVPLLVRVATALTGKLPNERQYHNASQPVQAWPTEICPTCPEPLHRARDGPRTCIFVPMPMVGGTRAAWARAAACARASGPRVSCAPRLVRARAGPVKRARRPAARSL